MSWFKKKHYAVSDAMVYGTGFYKVERDSMRVSSRPDESLDPNKAFKERKKH